MGFVLLLVSAALGSVCAWKRLDGVGWQQAEELPPWKPHTGSIATPLSNGSMLLIAGQAGRHGGANFDCFECMSEVWRFDLPSGAWSNLSEDVPWDPRWGHSALAMPDDTVWMLFGCCERGKPTVMLRDVWTYNPMKGLGWTRIATEPPFEGVQATSAAVRGDDIWVVGGWSQSRGTLSLVAVLNTVSLEWTVKSKNKEPPWPTRADHASAISPDGKWLVIFGGQHEEGGGKHWTRLKDTWRVQLPSALPSQWERLGDLTEARSSPALAVLSTGWLVTLGGHWTPETELLEAAQEDVESMQKHHENTSFHVYNDVLALDLLGGGTAWTVLEKDAPWPGRDDCAASVASNGALVLFGGGTLYGGGGYHQDVWMLEDAAEKYGLVKSTETKDKGDEL